MSRQAAAAIDALRTEGRRITTARRLVIELLARTPDHLTADDIADRIHMLHPEIHLSTVYRTLESLADWKLVEHVHQPHGPAFFHLTTSHMHVVCDECGRIGDLPAQEFTEFAQRIRERYGFELRLGHSALPGRCAAHANWGTTADA